MSQSSILLKLIHEKAMATKVPEIVITAKNYQHWVNLWFDTAERLAVSFDAEGLSETAKEIRAIIEQEKKYLK